MIQTALRIVGALAVVLGALPCLAQAPYPTRSVRMIVPFAAGGPTDVIARVVAQKLSESLGQQFYVENLPGAGGNTGTAQAAKAGADGYTLLVVSTGFIVNPSLYVKGVPYDPVKDFAPVTLVAASPNVLTVNPSVAAKSAQELIALIKASPGKFSFAQPATGSTPHLNGELFKLQFGLDLVMVPFTGAAPAVTSTIAGHTPIAFTALPPAIANIRDGKLRGLAVLSHKRVTALPDVPTAAEAGIPGHEGDTLTGIVVPAGTPKAVVDKLNAEIKKLVALPDVKEKLEALGFGPVADTPAEFAARITTETAKWAKVINKQKSRSNERRRAAMKRILWFAAACAALLAPIAAPAQQYPVRPVKIIIPFPPGGVTDIAGRVIAEKLSERLGQQFYIENQPGAGGNLGMGNVAKADGDGYTILLSSSSIVVNPNLYNKIPYDIDKDFIPVTKAGGTPNSWVVNASFPAKTMKELVDLIKREPGKHSVASPGTGTTPSLSIEMLKLGLGLDFVTVPFAGGGPMTQSLLGGHTPIACGALGNYVNLIKEGKLRALAVAAKKRSAALPDIPTLEEFGITGQEAETMTGVFVPAGTPKAIVDKLQQEFSTIVNLPDIKAKLLQLGVEAEGDSSASFAAYVKADVAKWKKVIEDGKINKI